jgi:hypothetical protein
MHASAFNAAPGATRPWLLFSSGGQFGGGGGAPNPFAATTGPGLEPPRKKSNAWIWFLGGIAVAGILAVVCCGGVGIFGFTFGTKVIGDELKKEVADHPEVQKHLGEVESVSMNLMASGEEGQKRPGQQVLVFDAKGSAGSGQFIVEQNPAPQPGNVFKKIDLRLPSDETISIK